MQSLDPRGKPSAVSQKCRPSKHAHYDSTASYRELGIAPTKLAEANPLRNGHKARGSTDAEVADPSQV